MTNQPAAHDSGASEDADELGDAEEVMPAFVVPSGSLKSLAPRYDEPSHGTYLRHLEQQVTNRQNLNIALTGRYGTGKSSILDKFVETHRADAVRLGISTLDPASPGAALTNRLQKEVVKQLLYQSDPRKLRLSRFNRISERDPWRAFGESLVAVLVVLGVLALPGWLPHLAGTNKSDPGILKVGAWAGFVLLLAGLLTAARLLILDRREVSDLSAGGASVKLTSKNVTYFDEYLDEIVYFFDKVSPKYVIFEDLDRFEDPHIFEALRELNTLINNSKTRKAGSEPVRFIYAIKDSLFEKLGADTRDADDDEATAETKRANRTKFFEVVIPVVPFISHRNARELLADELEARGGSEIDRKLIDLVARHATDMRLLHNMCNEYQVFAERLLASKKVAPGLNPDKLFALVAYKNFHLKDFERIARRESNLDMLYDQRRDLVAEQIADAQAARREQSNARTRSRQMKSVNEVLTARLSSLASGVSASASADNLYGSTTYVYYIVGGTTFSAAEADTYAFWKHVAAYPDILIYASNSEKSAGKQILTLDKGGIRTWFPEGLKARQWDELDARAVQKTADSLDADIAFLRGANFAALAKEPRFTLAPVASSATENGDETEDDAKAAEPRTFEAIVDATMTSDLARQLVKAGFIDLNYTLYAAQFYGHFSGLDVATFMIQNVNTNTMEMDYSFAGPESIESLLDEAPKDFTSSAASFNVAILDNLLAEHPTLAARVVETMLLGGALAREGTDAARFLSGYLNSGTRPGQLAAELAAQGWGGIFEHLVVHDSIPDDDRVPLVDAALLRARPGAGSYELGSAVRNFITSTCGQLTAIGEPQTRVQTTAITDVIEAADIVFPDLAVVAGDLNSAVVRLHRFDLTAPNLRAALGRDGSVNLGAVGTNSEVLKYCLAQPDAYLRAMEQDDATPYAITEVETLTAILEAVEDWTPEQVETLLGSVAPSVVLVDVHHAPESLWSPLADKHLFAASMKNVDAYRTSLGAIDASLGSLLTEAGIVEVDEDDEQPSRMKTAVAITNVRVPIADPETRTQLAVSLDLGEHIDPAAINPEEGQLLRLLLHHDLVPDNQATFVRFRPAGWTTIETAIAESEKFAEFADPPLLEGMVAGALDSTQVPEAAKTRILGDVAGFVPADDAAALRAITAYAVSRNHAMPFPDIQRIANVTQAADAVVPLLAVSDLAATDIVAVLAHLPAPHSNFATRAQTKFTLDDDQAHRAVLDILEKAGIADNTKVRLKDLRLVKLR